MNHLTPKTCLLLSIDYAVKSSTSEPRDSLSDRLSLIAEVIEWVVNCKQLEIMSSIEFNKFIKQQNLNAFLLEESSLFAVSYINKKEANFPIVTM